MAKVESQKRAAPSRAKGIMLVDLLVVCKDKECPAMFSSDGRFDPGIVLPCGHKIGGVYFSKQGLQEESEE